MCCKHEGAYHFPPNPFLLYTGTPYRMQGDEEIAQRNAPSIASMCKRPHSCVLHVYTTSQEGLSNNADAHRMEEESASAPEVLDSAAKIGSWGGTGTEHEQFWVLSKLWLDATVPNLPRGQHATKIGPLTMRIVMCTGWMRDLHQLALGRWAQPPRRQQARHRQRA